MRGGHANCMKRSTSKKLNSSTRSGMRRAQSNVQPARRGHALRCQEITDTDDGSAAVCNHIHTDVPLGTRRTMSKRINVMIDEDTWTFLGRVPVGERSRAINDALRAWITRRRRSDAVREMQALRTQLPKISTDEVTRWIREDREHGH